MAEQSKRGSQPQNGDRSHKKARVPGMDNAVVKQEQREEGEAGEEDQEEGEVRQGSDAAGSLAAATEGVEEPQLSLRLELALFHCRACRRPLKSPTFKCDAGHVVCFACSESHGQVCGAGPAYVPCAEVDAFVRSANQPCAFEEFGCKKAVVYHEAADHRRACPWAPCSCPCPGCDFVSSPARLLDHLAAAHSCPVTEVRYGKPHAIAVPPRGWHAVVAEEDRCVFLLSASAFGAAAVVSLVCVRANGDSPNGAPQYKCKLWAEGASNEDTVMMMIGPVRSSNLSGGLPAVDQGMFMAVPLDILHDAPGDVPVVMVRIDKTCPAASKSKTTSAASRRSARRLH